MIIKRSITIKGHSTSISLEATFWDALNEIAKKETFLSHRWWLKLIQIEVQK